MIVWNTENQGEVVAARSQAGLTAAAKEFEKPAVQVPTDVRNLTVVVSIYPAAEGVQAVDAQYSLELVDQDGQPIQFAKRNGKLRPYLSGEEESALAGFMEKLMARAKAHLVGKEE